LTEHEYILYDSEVNSYGEIAMSNRTGDLVFGAVGVGREVVCVLVPDMSLWERFFSKQVWVRPKKGSIYRLRASVIATIDGAPLKGILLYGIDNVQVNKYGFCGEPFFSCNAFCAH